MARQLTKEDFGRIHALLNEGKTCREIGDILQRHHTTISRIIKRTLPSPIFRRKVGSDWKKILTPIHLNFIREKVKNIKMMGSSRLAKKNQSPI